MLIQSATEINLTRTKMISNIEIKINKYSGKIQFLYIRSQIQAKKTNPTTMYAKSSIKKQKLSMRNKTFSQEFNNIQWKGGAE